VYPEARTALAAAERSGRIDQGSRRIAVKDLEGACASRRVIGVDWGLAQQAGEIAEAHALRGDDAVYLATALSVQDPDLVLVTWDHDLASAAVRAGRAVIPSVPREPPSEAMRGAGGRRVGRRPHMPR